MLTCNLIVTTYNKYIDMQRNVDMELTHVTTYNNNVDMQRNADMQLNYVNRRLIYLLNMQHN